MKPEEKAKELIEKFVGFKLNPYDDPEMRQTLYKAKQQTLICVDEIIESNPHRVKYTADRFDPLMFDKELKSNSSFWEEVKRYIEKS